MLGAFLQILIGLLLAGMSLAKIVEQRAELLKQVSPDQEALYLPSSSTVKLLSFGFRNAAARLLWFKTISYFGKHHASDQRYNWLGHMCTLVIELNPKDPYVAEFCSNMLSWEVGHPQIAIQILDKAIAAQPNNWRLLYLRGFQHMFFIQDSEKAQADLAASAKLPGAEAFVARLAAGTMAKSDNLDTAIEFLQELISSSKDRNERESLKSKLLETVNERSLRNIEGAIKLYSSQFGKAPDNLEQLVDKKIISGTLRDPWGGTYTYDPIKDLVTSTTNKKRRMNSKLPASKAK